MKRGFWQASVLVGLAAVAALATYQWHPRAPALFLAEEPLAEDEISLARIESDWQGRVIWLDARPEEEFQKGRIPGAFLLNEQGFHDQLFELLDVLQTADRPVVIYCSGQKCEASRKIRRKLLTQFPLEDVWILKGGWPAWRDSDGTIETPK